MNARRKQILVYNALCAAMEVTDRLKRPDLYEVLDLRPDRFNYAVSGETDILTLTGQREHEHVIVQSYIYSTGETKSILIVNGSTYDVKHERVSMLI